MRVPHCALLPLIGFALWVSATLLVAEPPPDQKAQKLPPRRPWTTSNVKGSPEPPAPYRTEVAFPKLKFYEPLEMVAAPGMGRLFVVERRGKIFSFANDPETDKAELFLDLGKTTYGFVCHPRFAENGVFYVVYILDPSKSEPKGTRLSRFRVRRDDPLRADKDSEEVIFEWPSGGHNGGCIRFGPDGMLYIATGDGSGIADEFLTGQDLSDHLGCILRIDVDRADPGKKYAVPPDNPFVGVPGVQPEIWAYGLRQPWKFSFDRATGALWAGEVGQDLWEMVYRIEKGGNYGWSVQEGSHPFRPERPRGPTPILPPVVEHPHSDFRSITGGYVYHGRRLPDLHGAYIYGDYDTGRVWALRYDNGKVVFHQELADTPLRLVAFGEDHHGELLLVDFMTGLIHRLVPAPAVPPSKFPRKLSETGLFASTKDHIPAEGVIPYSVNAQLWSDHAHKERFLAIPGLGRIQYDAIEYPQPSPGAPRGWKFPDGTVVVKTFSLEMERGNPASRRRLETRILHFEQLEGTEEVGDQYWHGYTYIWNDDQTDAVLLESQGLDRTYTIKDPTAPGGVREQIWHFPSRAECTLCHTMAAKYVLGLNTLQLNRDHDYGGIRMNQLRAFEQWGLFEQPPPMPPEQLPRLVDYSDPSQPLDLRARSYLHANCAHCHMKWGGGNADFYLLATLPLEQMGIVHTRPGHGSFDIPDARILVPGRPERSLLLHRMTRVGLGRMPHVASNVVDEEGVQLISAWIKSLKDPAK
ncbi:MAG: PQQ-dependent sugar dehydrogenase [Gemmatales bacterium]|nr:PQQ-dependent sugar dehydrogenase [Gemmatales bacterium]MDW8387896.1 PQQ-dependent sugar dehydrogenase [Gemmatales bacterium]